MGKNGSAATVRKGGKPQDLTSPDASGTAANNTTVLDQGAADGQAEGAGSSDTSSQAATPPAPDLTSANSQAASSEALTITAGILGAAGISATDLTGTELSSITQAATALATGLQLDASSDKSSTVVAGGTGESFGKMLADSFRSTAGLKVTSRQAGFRRAGHAWSITPTVIALSELTDDQVLQLKGEPMLKVELVDLEDEEA